MFFHAFFVDVEGRRAKIIICHQNKIVLHEHIWTEKCVKSVLFSLSFSFVRLF